MKQEELDKYFKDLDYLSEEVENVKNKHYLQDALASHLRQMPGNRDLSKQEAISIVVLWQSTHTLSEEQFAEEQNFLFTYGVSRTWAIRNRMCAGCRTFLATEKMYNKKFRETGLCSKCERTFDL